jgi:hypothetical protein
LLFGARASPGRFALSRLSFQPVAASSAKERFAQRDGARREHEIALNPDGWQGHECARSNAYLSGSRLEGAIIRPDDGAGGNAAATFVPRGQRRGGQVTACPT